MSRRKVLRGIAAGVGAAATSTLAVGRNSTASAEPNSMVNVLDFGVTGDGVTDDHDAIQAVVTATGGARPIYFPAGRYRIGTTGAPDANRITMPTATHLSFANGAVVEVNAIDNQLGSAIFFAAGSDGTKTRLTAAAEAGNHSVLLPPGESAKLLVGDIIGFESQGLAGDYGARPWHVREFHSVASTDATTVYLDGPLEYSYRPPDSAVFWRITTTDDIIIDGAVFECGPGVKAGTDGSFPIRLQKVKNFQLKNVQIRDMIGGIAIYDSYNGHISSCTIDGLPFYSSSFGYGLMIGGSSARIRVDDLHGSNTRHLFTTVAEERGSGPQDATFWGGPIQVQVNNGVGYGAPNGWAIWDTHEFGRHIEFNNCHAFDGGAAVVGFQMRAQDVTLNNCSALRNGARGVALTERSKRVSIVGGEFGFSGSEGMAVSGESHQIMGAYVHDCVGAGIAIANSADALIQTCSIANNLYGVQDGGAKGSANARIKDCVIPYSPKQTISILNLGTSAVADNLLCLGYESMGGLWNSATSAWGAPSGATYSIMTSNGWISSSPPPTTTPR